MPAHQQRAPPAASLRAMPESLPSTPRRIAVIGAGLAGSRCAQQLARAGHAVQVFDKARGPGGRLATRRLASADPPDQPAPSLDHGAPGLLQQAPAGGWPPGFERDFLAAGQAQGWLLDWTPRRPDGSRGAPHWRVQPPQPQACRALLGPLPLHTGHTLAGLQREGGRWQLLWAEPQHAVQPGFDSVLLAMPPAQAAALLAPLQPDWARAAALVTMQPCWTLMLITAPLAVDWDELLPPPASASPLQRVLRQDARRPELSGCSLWVAHARPGWSREHLEAEPAAAQAALRAAWGDALQAAGQPLPAVQQALVHRWRYAELLRGDAGSTPAAWWDPGLRLGVCGDWLGGGGLSGAWASGQALAEALGHG